MVGVEGSGLTVTVVLVDVRLQPLALVTVTEKLPEADTVMLCVVAPLLHRYEAAAELVKVTLPPAQKVVGPLAVIVGTAGRGCTVTDVLAEVRLQPLALVTVTEKTPDVETVILCVVAPLLQRYDGAAELVKVTLPPTQKVVGPLAVMVGTPGSGFLTTLVAAEVREHPFASVTVTE